MSLHIPFWQTHVAANEVLPGIKEVLDSGFLNDGPVTNRLEAELAKLLGFRHCVMTTSATAALFLVVKAVSKGDSAGAVAIPDITFIATANAARLAGKGVRLIGVDPVTRCMDLGQLERAIHQQRIDMVVLVDVSGHRVHLPQTLRILCAEKNITLIEDAAEAMGTADVGKHTAAACLSFSPNKLITSGQGGCVLTNSDEIDTAVRALKDQGRLKRGTGGDDTHFIVGYNFKYTDLQAVVLLSMLEKHFQARVLSCQRRHERYKAALSNCRHFKLAPFNERDVPLWTDIMCNTPAIRMALCSHLGSLSIGYRKYWRPVHRQTPYKSLPKAYLNGNEQELSERLLWLPSAFTLTPEDVDAVCDVVKAWDDSYVGN